MARRGGSETHDLRLTLSLQDRGMARGLASFSKHLRSLRKDALSTIKTVNTLDKTLSKLSKLNTNKFTMPKSAATGAASTRAAREQVKLMQDAVRLEKEQARLKQATARATTAERSAEMADVKLLREKTRLEREAAKVTGRGGRRRRTRYDESDGIDRFNRGVRTARNVAYVATRTYDMVKGGFIDPALELKREQTRYQLLGYPKGEQDIGLKAVEDVVKQTKGVRQTDVQAALTELTGVMGNVNDAVAMLPLASKFLASTEAIYGDKFGRGEAIKAFTDANRAVELMGKDIDRNVAKQYVNFIAQASLATGGDINPSEFKQFTKYGQMPAMQLSPEGMAKMLPVIQQMGGASSGTALTSLYSSVVGGQIPSQKLKYWQELGLLDKSKVEFNKQGRVSRLRPDAIPIAKGMGADPFIFTDRLMSAFQKKGIDTTDVGAVAKQIEVMFGSRTAKREVAQMMVMRTQLAKETANYKRAPSIEEFYKQVFETGNPLGQFQELNATQLNARASAGTPMMTVGGNVAEQLSNQIKNLQGSSAEHPYTTTAMIGILSLGKASAEAADGVGVFDSMLRGSKGGKDITGGASTGIASGGASLLSKIGWGAVGAIANPVGFSIAGTVGAIYASYKKIQGYREQLGRERGANTSLVDVRTKRDKGLANDADYITSARLARESLLKGGELGRAKGDFTVKEFENNLYRKLASPFYGNQPLPTDKEMIQRFAPQLSIPEVREGFYKNELPNLGLSKQGQDNLQKTIESLYGSVSKQTVRLGTDGSAMPNILQTFLGIVDPAQKASEAFGQIIEPALKFPPAIKSSADAAQDFANRVRALELKQPSFNLSVGSDGKIVITDTNNPTPPKADGSAIGSIVKRSGLVAAHKGNVIFPASLSRRSAGDWLKSADSISRTTNFINETKNRSTEARYLRESAYIDNESSPSMRRTDVGASSPQVVINFSPNIKATFTGNPRENAATMAQMEQMLENCKDELFRDFKRRLDYIDEREDSRS